MLFNVWFGVLIIPFKYLQFQSDRIKWNLRILNAFLRHAPILPMTPNLSQLRVSEIHKLPYQNLNLFNVLTFM